MPYDEKQKYLKKVKCLIDKASGSKYLSYKYNDIINKLNELLRNNNSVATPQNKSPLQYPHTYPPLPHGESKICTIKDFNDCNDISNRCAYTPLGLKLLVNKININKYRYKNDKSDSMLKTLECLKTFMDSNNYNPSDRSLYVKIENYIEQIKKLPQEQQTFRTGQVNAPLPPLNNKR